MNWLRSFRWRILSGAFFWTLGLIPVGYLVFVAVHYRSRGRITLPSVATGTTLVFAFFCLLAGIWQIRAGLAPFGRLRRQLSGVRDGSGRRIEGTYPIEVQPLVNDLNSLLEHREQIVRRALAKAGDLAHGLKTPLAVLAQEADRVEAEGQPEVAASIHHQIERMRRQVDYHLAHARAAGSGGTPGAHCVVLVSAEGLRARCFGFMPPADLILRWTFLPNTRFEASAKTWMRCWGICWITHANGPGQLSACNRCGKMAVSSFSLMTMDRVLSRRCAM